MTSLLLKLDLRVSPFHTQAALVRIGNAGGPQVSQALVLHFKKQKIKVMEMADKAVGFLLTTISLTIFSYYTFWVIILPFVDSDHFIHRYFLPREYAILIPVFAGVIILSFLSVFIGYVMLKSKKKST